MLESPDYFFRVREIGRLRQTTGIYGLFVTDEIHIRHYVVISPFSASWRIVGIADSALPQTMHGAASLRSSEY